MGRFIFPLFLIALGIAGLAEHERINNEWGAMYPEDEAHQDALTRCAQEDSNFNRFSSGSRDACYQKYLEAAQPAATPGISVGVPGAPLHAVPHAPPMRTNTYGR